MYVSVDVCFDYVCVLDACEYRRKLRAKCDDVERVIFSCISQVLIFVICV